MATRNLTHPGGNTTSISAKIRHLDEIADCSMVSDEKKLDDPVVEGECYYMPYGPRIKNMKTVATRGDIAYARKSDTDPYTDTLRPVATRLNGIKVPMKWTAEDVVEWGRARTLAPGAERTAGGKWVSKRLRKRILECVSTPGTIPSDVTERHVNQNIAVITAGKTETRFTSINGIARNEAVVAMPPDPYEIEQNGMRQSQHGGPYGGTGGDEAIVFTAMGQREATLELMEPFVGVNDPRCPRIMRILGEMANRFVEATDTKPLSPEEQLELYDTLGYVIAPREVAEHFLGTTASTIPHGDNQEGQFVAAGLHG